MNWIYLFLKFLIGGGTVVAATVLAKYIDPKWAGLVAAAPIISALSFIFIAMESDIASTQKYLWTAMYFMVPALFFLATLYFSNMKFPYVASFAIACIVFGVIVLLMQKFIS